MPHTRLHRAAFTLIELAIVLAIIGLIVGGIMGGSALLRQSEMQTVVADFSKYSTATAQFSAQYGGLPGDILDATDYWGDDNAACADAAVTNGTPGTCNGNNNGNMSESAEPYRAWQQLVLANLISGNFTGVASGGGAVPGTNVPKSRISNTGWSFGYKAVTASNANDYDQGIANFLAVGGPISGGITQAPSLKPRDAWGVDAKLDDGMPALGRIITRKPAALANCATSATDASATYNLTYDSAACSLNMSLTMK
jgi:prepilin-type N-terminal cleavage/methylation domain-containing protein